jgi:Mg-chelatase subunit ChlD
MDKEITFSQQVLMAGKDLEIVFLLKLINNIQLKNTSLDVRFLLDNSGSMSEESGSRGQNKITVLRNSVADSLSLLRENQDSLMVVTFSSEGQTEVLIPSQIMSKLTKVQGIIRGIDTKNMTHMSTGLKNVVGQDSPVPESIKRVVVFTDGVVNDPNQSSEENACMSIARDAKSKGVPLTIFATGVQYNPKFLQGLAETTGIGSSYLHVKQTGEVKALLEEEFQALINSGARNVNVKITALNGVKILDAIHLVPDQLGLGNGDEVEDDMQVLDARGQNYVVRMGVGPNSPGRLEIGSIELSWVDEATPHSETIPLIIDLTDNPEEVSVVDKGVAKTLYTAAAVSATLKGKYGVAETLFTKAGVSDNDPVMKTLKTMKKGGDEDEKRTLHTQARTIHTKK